MIRDGKVIHEIELPAPPAEVFSMFLDPSRMVRWIGLSADLEPTPGGRFRFEVQPGQFCEGEYLVVEPPRRLVFTWGWTDRPLVWAAARLLPGRGRAGGAVRRLPAAAGSRSAAG